MIEEQTSGSGPDLSPTTFRVLVGALLLMFLTVQVVYSFNLPLVMDEFQGATIDLHFAEALPNREYVSYKTVRGYYYQLPILLAVDDWWTALRLAKLQLAATVTVVLAYGSTVVARAFGRLPTVVALGLLHGIRREP